MHGLEVGRAGEKPMTPTESGVLVDTTAVRRTAHRIAIDQRLSVLLPVLTMPQSGQRRTGEGIESLAARGAAIARQALRMAPVPARVVMTGRAGWRLCQHARDPVGRHSLRRLGLRLQYHDRPLALSGRQVRSLPQPLAERLGTHDGLLQISISLS
jgi:hypothetical protein